MQIVSIRFCCLRLCIVHGRLHSSAFVVCERYSHLKRCKIVINSIVAAANGALVWEKKGNYISDSILVFHLFCIANSKIDQFSRYIFWILGANKRKKKKISLDCDRFVFCAMQLTCTIIDRTVSLAVETNILFRQFCFVYRNLYRKYVATHSDWWSIE